MLEHERSYADVCWGKKVIRIFELKIPITIPEQLKAAFLRLSKTNYSFLT